MCEPTTIALATTAVAGALTAVGQVQQASAQKGQAKYQAAVARNNQIMAERAAKDAEERGRVDELNRRIQTRQLIGRQRASLAANGVEVGSGSAIDIISDSALIGEVDALTIRNNAAREAQGFRYQGANYGSEARLYDAQRRNISAALPFAVGGTVLGTAGQVSDQWYNYYGASSSASGPTLKPKLKPYP